MIPYDWQAIGYGVVLIGFALIAWPLVVRRGS
jgi:hypothetical protein